MKSKVIFFSQLSLINQLRGFYAKNQNGRYNHLIIETIKELADNDFKGLVTLCQRDSSLAEICSLPLDELQGYWRSKYSLDNEGNFENYFESILESLCEEEKIHALDGPLFYYN